MTGSADKVTLLPGSVSRAELRAIWAGSGVELAADGWAALEQAADSVSRIAASGETVYGINTGFGLLAQTHIDSDHLTELQRNLVMSHACGIGPELDRHVVRLILVLKIIGLARGYSGVRKSVVQLLIRMLADDLLPVVPAQGSVGASGDLAPLAHVAAAMMGVGHMMDCGTRMDAGDLLAKHGIEALTLAPKEGLALLNGTQVSTAIALDALFSAENVFATALVSGALSVDAVKGSDDPFDERIHALRGAAGQILVADTLRELLAGSDIRQSHQDCDKVQDPYSLRCQPQVMGASHDLIEHVARTLVTEANAVTDNPLIFPDCDLALSGGNFHAQPVAFAADILTMALCEVGSLSERRIAVLVDPNMSGLPAFLIEDNGLNSGFMIPQVAAAALASENKTQAFPASVDSIPTSANQEDHVSMAPIAARKSKTVVENTAGVIGIELLAAAQGIELHRPLQTSSTLSSAVGAVRNFSAFLDRDRYLADEISTAKGMVLNGQIRKAAGAAVATEKLF